MSDINLPINHENSVFFFFKIYITVYICFNLKQTFTQLFFATYRHKFLEVKHTSDKFHHIKSEAKLCIKFGSANASITEKTTGLNYRLRNQHLIQIRLSRVMIR